MRVALLIHTPGQAHLWRYPIKALKQEGHDVTVIARDDGFTCGLLESFGIQFDIYGRAAKIRQKIFRLPAHFLNSLTAMKRYHPDIVVGASFIEAYCAFLLHKPCLIFEDSEATPSLERIQWKYLVDAILTPDCFKLDFKKRHVRIAGYKELAYLHPNYFKPDPDIFKELKISPEQKYIILRFNGFDAFHDVTRRGFSLEDKYELVRELEKHAKIFISHEGKLPEDLKIYELPTSPQRIHHALFYAHMLVADTGTMITEAAVLGTPGVINLSNVRSFGNFMELEERYGLIHTFTNPPEAIRKSVELIQRPDLKNEWEKKRQKLLNEKIDVTRFLVDFIEKYPENRKNETTTKIRSVLG
jgi:predicted glycosyltransferase